MKTANINVRVDENLKHDAEIILKHLGLNMTSAINIYLNSIRENDGIPFELKLKHPNNRTLEAINELESGGGHVCNTVDDLRKELSF
jgi:DNA-damage-inducible protein J